MAILAILAAVFVAVVLSADIGEIADRGWRDIALWSSGAALVLLGAGLGVAPANGSDPVTALDAPIPLAEALAVENLTSVALPIEERTVVGLELTVAGRGLLAQAMRCRPVDFRVNRVIGTAIGGTWAQPLVLVSQPFDADGDPVSRCRRAIVRLPIAAGVARPS